MSFKPGFVVSCARVSDQVETHAANHHLVVADLASARGGLSQQASAIGDDDIHAAQSFAAAVRGLDEAHACVLKRHLDSVARILAQRDFRDTAPALGKSA